MTGVDIYPLLIEDQPDNLNLFGYNLNDRLNDPEVFERNAYDLVHSRFVGQGIKTSRWASYVQDIKRLLRPNGWLQMVEYYPNIQSDNGRLSSQSALRRWWEAYVSAMERSNRSPRIGQRLQSLMSEAGLRDVGGSILHLPIGGWDPGRRSLRICFLSRLGVDGTTRHAIGPVSTAGSTPGSSQPHRGPVRVSQLLHVG